MRKLILMLVALFALATVASATPENVSSSEWQLTLIGARGPDAAGQVAAEGGNVSKLNISNEYSTTFWHGFFGNVTSAVVLSDGSNNFYSWIATSPVGEIYFARTDVDNWGNVIDSTSANVASEQVDNNMANSSTAPDNLTETYVDGSHTAFSVGSTAIAPPTPRVNLSSVFESVFLWNTGASEAVYAAIINQDQNGYDGDSYDFEVLLPTDGSNTAYYYVYAELE